MLKIWDHYWTVALNWYLQLEWYPLWIDTLQWNQQIVTSTSYELKKEKKKKTPHVDIFIFV